VTATTVPLLIKLAKPDESAMILHRCTAKILYLLLSALEPDLRAKLARVIPRKGG
jgi:hypothetical protein